MTTSETGIPLTVGRAWWLVRRDIERGFAAAWHDHFTSTLILDRRISVPKAHADDTSPPVHVLAGEEQWLMAAWMLTSFLHFTDRPWNIFVHDDGTLSENARAELIRLFDGITIVPRSDADVVMKDTLGMYPRCAAYRDAHPLGIKCFDIPHMAKGERFLLLDSDVLFFKRPDQILAWAEDENDHSTWFNQDPQEPSSLSLDQCQSDLGFSLWPRVNSGLCLLHKDSIRLTNFEQWLELAAIKNGIAWRTEQTLLALGASRTGKGGLLPEGYEVSLGKTRKPDAIARHYVGAVRSRFYAEGVRDLKGCLLN
ncbi:MAG: hypothetical protein R3F19_13770 [Verrucomicrobiales bacterium]